ncbi:single-stranded DNA-binding protein [Bartonella sp. DGB2]|uniref:single-stranded DNA-binding protein n=1 Tax=Bartonella sp. DGB2 TaxID=3388426 RepID=UPI00398FA408
MFNVNKVIIAGNLGFDPVLKQAGNADVSNISVATTSYRGSGDQRQEITEWHRVILFNHSAKYAARYLSKGDNVYIEGRLQTRKWSDDRGEHTITEIVADVIQGNPSRRNDQLNTDGNTGNTTTGAYEDSRSNNYDAS